MNVVRLGANLLEGTDALFRGFGLRWPSLDGDRLLSLARRRVGLADFGDERFLEGLTRLLHSYDNEAELNGFGRMAAHHDVLRLLCNRLHLQADRNRIAGIADQRVHEPVFVVGLPRSGTTFLHKLLACDPRFRAPLTWEMLWPSPPPGDPSWDRRLSARADWQTGLLYQLAPQFRSIHFSAADEPEECLLIQAHSFQSYQFQTTHRVPGYQQWLESQDLDWSYGEHCAFLQQLQLRRPESRWLLKAPAHLYGLSSLMRTYPDAKIVFLHRNPLEALASTISLHVVLRRVFSRHVDAAEVASEMSERWGEGLARAMDARDRGWVPASQWADVNYHALVVSPMATVFQLYSQMGLVLDGVAEDRMRRFLHDRPKDLYGTHCYEPDEAVIDAVSRIPRLYDYRQRFAV